MWKFKMSKSFAAVAVNICSPYIKLKGSDKWEVWGVKIVTNDKYWPRTVVMDILSFLNWAAILKDILYSRWPLTPAELIGDILANRAVSMSVPLIMHQYIGATNYLALIYWCCQHTQSPRHLIIGAEC